MGSFSLVLIVSRASLCILWAVIKWTVVLVTVAWCLLLSNVPLVTMIFLYLYLIDAEQLYVHGSGGGCGDWWGYSCCCFVVGGPVGYGVGERGDDW